MYFNRVTVGREEPCRLKRKAWTFNVWPDKIILERYAEEERQTTRHKWRGDYWEASDERFYNSKIKRPENVPDDVLRDALEENLRQFKARKLKVYIARTREECFQGEVTH